jgi:hypothetical protein
MGCILAVFYAVQKPITPTDLVELRVATQAFQQAPTLTGIIDAVLDLGAALLIVSAAVLLGCRLSPLPYPITASPLVERAEFWLLAIGLGFGIISITTFLLGLLGWLNLLVVVNGVLVALALRLPRAPRLRCAVRDWRDSRPHTRLPAVLFAFTLISLLLALLTAWTPPFAFDSLLYHLTLPRRALELGRITPLGELVPSESFPQLMTSLYLLAMRLRNDISAQLLHYTYGVLLLGLIMVAARRYTRNAVPYALALTLSMPNVLLLASWAYVDLALAFYALAATYAFRRWRDTQAPHYLWYSAIMTGFTMGLKYTSFVLPLGLGALLIITARRHSIRLALQFSLIAGLVAAPWYIKNFLFTGNPVHPFVFGGAHWDNLRAAWYAQAGTGIGFDAIALLTLPFVAMLGYRDATYIDGRFGPLLVIAAPLLLITLWRARSAITRAPDPHLMLCLLYCVFWTLGVMNSLSLWQGRLLLPALVNLAPPLGYALTSLAWFEGPAFSLRRITNLVIALVLGLTLLTQTIEFLKVNPLAYLVGAESREHFLTRQWGDHARAMYAVRELPPTTRVQFLWEPRPYLSHQVVRADILLDALPHVIATTGSLEAGVQQWKREGFTHVLVWETGAQFAFKYMREFTPADAANLQRLEHEHLRLVYENPSYRLFEFK